MYLYLHFNPILEGFFYLINSWIIDLKVEEQVKFQHKKRQKKSTEKRKIK